MYFFYACPNFLMKNLKTIEKQLKKARFWINRNFSRRIVLSHQKANNTITIVVVERKAESVEHGRSAIFHVSFSPCCSPDRKRFRYP